VQLHPDLKILYMTGYSRNAIVHQGRLDAGVDLLQKPLSHEQLSAMVRKVLNR
jgi:CheY-like chemotaxis protein